MRKYTISEGRRYSGLHFCFHYNKRVAEYKLRLSKECWWDKPRNNDDYDINKLCGMSFGYHMKNSVRIGWVPDFKINDKINLYAFCHNNGKMQFYYITSVFAGQEFKAKITVKSDMATFEVSGHKMCVMFDTPKTKWGYELYPYFGGNNTSPKEMNFFIERI